MHQQSPSPTRLKLTSASTSSSASDPDNSPPIRSISTPLFVSSVTVISSVPNDRVNVATAPSVEQVKEATSGRVHRSFFMNISSLSNAFRRSLLPTCTWKIAKHTVHEPFSAAQTFGFLCMGAAQVQRPPWLRSSSDEWSPASPAGQDWNQCFSKGESHEYQNHVGIKPRLASHVHAMPGIIFETLRLQKSDSVIARSLSSLLSWLLMLRSWM